MKKLNSKEMETIEGGREKSHCGTVTGLMCSATLIISFTPFFPIASATGIGCLVGISAGCTQ